MHKFSAALVATSLLLSSVASAEDARITCTGTVTEILGGGLAGSTLAGAAVGETVRIVFDAEIARQLPFGEYLYTVNTPSSSISIGAASAGFTYSVLNRLNIRDNFVQGGDYFSIGAQLGDDSSTTFLMQLFDPSGTALNTQDVRDFYGTSLDLSAFEMVFYAHSLTGTVRFDVDSVQVDAAPGGLIGSPYCTAAPNSTGAIGTTTAYGLQTPGDNDMTLTASGLPMQSFGYFLVSSTQGFVAGPGGSDGNLCLGGAIGRFVGQDQIIQSDFGGEIALPVDLAELPSPMGSLMVQAGQTWNFQLWHRDDTLVIPTSNFTQGLSVTFL